MSREPQLRRRLASADAGPAVPWLVGMIALLAAARYWLGLRSSPRRLAHAQW
jgi:hypothetical protein